MRGCPLPGCRRLLCIPGSIAAAPTASPCAAHLSEVSRVELVHVDTHVVLATGITATVRVLAVLANTTVPSGDVPAGLSVLLEPCAHERKGQ